MSYKLWRALWPEALELMNYQWYHPTAMMLLPVRFKTMTKSATVVTGGTQGLLWKPYLTVEEEAMMSWSIQFVVKHERPILPSQHPGGEIVDSQPVVEQTGGGCSQYSFSGQHQFKSTGLLT